MQLHQLQPMRPRRKGKRIGRGGKRGTTSGGGTKGQKSRSGASVKPGFRGGDNRLWQLFPKQRGASKKPGSGRPHRKHKFYRLQQPRPVVVDLGKFNVFENGSTVTPELLVQQGLIAQVSTGVKVLGAGELKRQLVFEGFSFSESARAKIAQAGGQVK